MTVRRLRPILIYLLLASLGISSAAIWIAAAEVDVVQLWEHFKWEPGPTVPDCR